MVSERVIHVRPYRPFLTCSYHVRWGSHPVSTRSVLAFKTCTHAPQTLQGPHKASGRQARHGRDTCICSRMLRARCTLQWKSGQRRSGRWRVLAWPVDRDPQTHDRAKATRGRPRASLDRPWPRRDTRTPTLCRHRRSPVDAADRRRQLRASNLPQPDSRRARLDKRRSQACRLMRLSLNESMPGRHSARPGWGWASPVQ